MKEMLSVFSYFIYFSFIHYVFYLVIRVFICYLLIVDIKRASGLKSEKSLKVG